MSLNIKRLAQRFTLCAAITANNAGYAEAAKAIVLEPPVISSNELNQLAFRFQESVAAAKVPAAALVIIQTYPRSTEKPTRSGPGQRAVAFIRAFGNATPETPFRLGSITKTFTALALLQAASDTQTALSTPATKLLGDQLWDNRWRSNHPITLGQLTELSAGFSDLSGAEFASALPVERTTALTAHRDSHIAHWPPGQMHSYSNLPPAFTALAIEKLTGKNFERYLRTRVLAPLGLPNASLAPLDKLPGGFRMDGKTPIPYWHTIYPAFGALNATPTEFANFLGVLATGAWPDALAAAIEQRSSKPLYQPLTTAAARAGLTLGYGAGIYGWENHGQLFVGHGGDADGYRSRYAVMPATGRGYFFVLNTDNPGLARSLRNKLEKRLAADLRPQVNALSQTKSEPPVPQDARAYSGEYVPATSRFGVGKLSACAKNSAKLRIQGETLLWRQGSRTKRLKHTVNGLYRELNASIASVALVNLSDRKHVLGELGNWRRIARPDREQQKEGEEGACAE